MRLPQPFCRGRRWRGINVKRNIGNHYVRDQYVRDQLTARQEAVERLLEVHKAPPEPPAPAPASDLPRLKRYYNE